MIKKWNYLIADVEISMRSEKWKICVIICINFNSIAKIGQFDRLIDVINLYIKIRSELSDLCLLWSRSSKINQQ